MEWVTALLAFAGAALGAGVGYRAAAAATRVERVAREREEWGRRFTTALAAVTAREARQVATGQALLVELMRSDLASAEDRRQARAVLESVAAQVGFVNLRLVPPEGLESLEIVRDTGDTDPTRGDDE